MQKVSVIIPTYNRRQTLGRALDSVLLTATGTSKPKRVPGTVEIIVVDDGSTDGTSDWLRQKYSELRLFTAERRGPAAARNTGIKHARHDWIAFLDSDDEWLPGKLSAQFEFFEKNPQYLICQTEEIWIRNGLRVNPMKKHQKFGGEIFEKCLPLCIVSPSATMLHKKLLDEVGFFDETLPACEDYDLWLRIAARHPIGLIETPYIKKYGGHADQQSRVITEMDQYRIRSLVKLLGSGRLDEEKKEAALHTLKEKAQIFVNGALKRGRLEDAGEIFDLVEPIISITRT
ncbi:MAG: glycosyltransferase family 2 protein [Candidatus Omnitrophota bacterium]